MMITGAPGKPIPLRLTVGSGTNDLYVLASIQKPTGEVVDVVELSPIGYGVYTGEFSYPATAHLVATFIAFNDELYTELAGCIPITSEDYRIESECVRYECRMTTVIDTDTCQHEVLVWLDQNGQRVTSTANATIVIKNSSGAVSYSGSLVAPNADGVFRFTNEFHPEADTNFYVVITIEKDGTPYTSHQSFFTMG